MWPAAEHCRLSAFGNCPVHGGVPKARQWPIKLPAPDGTPGPAVGFQEPGSISHRTMNMAPGRYMGLQVWDPTMRAHCSRKVAPGGIWTPDPGRVTPLAGPFPFYFFSRRLRVSGQPVLFESLGSWKPVRFRLGGASMGLSVVTRTITRRLSRFGARASRRIRKEIGRRVEAACRPCPTAGCSEKLPRKKRHSPKQRGFQPALNSPLIIGLEPRNVVEQLYS